MAGGINSNHFVEHMAGGVHGSPGLCGWQAGSGSTLIVGPTFTNAFPGPPPFENQTSDGSYRAFHRSVSLGSSASGVWLYAWHQDKIWANTSPPNWSIAHTCANQIVVNSNDRFGGDHTGLYPVHSRDGSRLWVLGFYRTNANTIGVVKYDTLTNTWTSFDTGRGAHAAPFSVCDQWRCQLAHAGASGLLLFDPLTNNLSITSYGGTQKDWLYQQSGRLFIAAKLGANLHVLEWVAAGMLDHGTVTGTTENTNASGGWSIIPYTDSTFYVPYYTTTGGTGWRIEKVYVPTTTPGDPITMSDLPGVIPDGSGGGGIGDYTWPAGAQASAFQQFLPGLDCAEAPRGAFGATGGTFGGFHISSPTGGSRFTDTHGNLAWNGELTRITAGSPSFGASMTGIYSYPISRWGRGYKDLSDGTGPWIESVAAYSDGTVARGLLIKFRVHVNTIFAPSGGAFDLQALFGFPGGLYSGPGINPCTLSVGDGIDLGGTATLNVGAKSLDGIVGQYGNGLGLIQAVLSHNAPSAGPGFSPGETVTGSLSGSTGQVMVVKGAPYWRIGVARTGSGFVSGETITGSGSGTVAVLNANEDPDPLHQVIWDLGADSVPDFDIAELSTVCILSGTPRPPSLPGLAMVGPVQQVYTSIADPPSETGSNFEQPIALTDASSPAPSEIGQPVGLTDAETVAPSVLGQPAALTDAPADSISILGQPLVSTDLIPDSTKPSPGRPTCQMDGSIGVQLDGAEQGVREVLNHDNKTVPGQELEFATQLPDGPSVLFRLDGLVELGRVSFDAVNDSSGSTKAILDLSAEGMDNVIVEVLVVLASNVSGVSVQPSISVGTNTPNWDDQVASTALTLTATDEAEDVSPSVPSKVARSSDVITAQLDSQATATSYDVEVIAYGRQRIPA